MFTSLVVNKYVHTLHKTLFSSRYTRRILFQYSLLYSYTLSSQTVALSTKQQAFVLPQLLFPVSLSLFHTLYLLRSFLCQTTSLIHIKVSFYKVLIILFSCGTPACYHANTNQRQLTKDIS